MATQSLNKNIFELLSDKSDGEDEMKEVKVKSTEKRIRTKAKKVESEAVEQNVTNVNDSVTQKQSDNHRGQKNPKDSKQSKGVSGEPHPLDRRSGTGRGKEVPKQGAGRHNYGTFKDDLKQEPTEEQQQETVVEEEPEDQTFTLEEYLANQAKVALNKKNNFSNEVDKQALAKLEKEGCELIQKKADIDDRQGVKQKQKKVNEKYNMIAVTEHSELLGVRTGLKTYSEKPREQRVEKPVVKHEKKEEEPKSEEKTEEVKEEKPREQRKPRGDGPRGDGPRGDGPRGDGPRGEGHRGEGHRGEGHRGEGHRGDGPRRGGRGGNNQRGERRPYEDRRPKQTKGPAVNVEDDSSFPTLG